MSCSSFIPDKRDLDNKIWKFFHRQKHFPTPILSKKESLESNLLEFAVEQKVSLLEVG